MNMKLVCPSDEKRDHAEHSQSAAVARHIPDQDSVKRLPNERATGEIRGVKGGILVHHRTSKTIWTAETRTSNRIKTAKAISSRFVYVFHRLGTTS
jgi:hypothetical protein